MKWSDDDIRRLNIRIGKWYARQSTWMVPTMIVVTVLDTVAYGLGVGIVGATVTTAIYVARQVFPDEAKKGGGKWWRR